jgi:hypothetical protein
MASRWVKAAFLAILGIVIMIYLNGFVRELKANLSDRYNISFDETWTLLLVLLWILVAWLFVDAVMIIALSFRGDVYTTHDVMEKLKAIDKKLGHKAGGVAATEVEELQEPAVTQTEEVPPPPKE